MSKAMEKLLNDWDGGDMTGLELAERAHAIGYREGRKSRGKVVAQGWAWEPTIKGFPHDYLSISVVDQRNYCDDIPVEVVAKKVRRAKT